MLLFVIVIIVIWIEEIMELGVMTLFYQKT